MTGAVQYFRPLVQTGAARPTDAVSLAGGPLWFTHAEQLHRNAPSEIVTADRIPAEVIARLSTPRAPICGLTLDQPRLMGVLNVTPDSFSDGGRFDEFALGLEQARALIAEGADILDIGGESTRPGSDTVPAAIEIARTQPMIEALMGDASGVPISIDTRKAEVARVAMGAGASLINDVSALGFDAAMTDAVIANEAPICLMHALGDPKTMQVNPVYNNVLLDVYDYLQDRVAYCEAHGIARDRIMVDPGIGFGKTQDHNLALIRGLSLFHGLGCAILLGVSRKRFIGTISGEAQADRRVAGSIAIGLEGVRQGVQMLRVHDIRDTKQALALWQASR